MAKALGVNSHWQSLRKAWTDKEFPLKVFGAKGPWAAAMLSNLAPLSKGSMLIVTPSDGDAQTFAQDISLFYENVHHFPWWGTMLYKGVSPQASIFGRRSTILAELVSGERCIVVASLRAALGLLPPPGEIADNILKLQPGDKLDTESIKMRLPEFGYNRVPRVSVPGEFALRGEVLDIYPPGSEQAIRVVFSWDEIEEIKSFDPFSQASSIKLDHAVLHPLRELIWDSDKTERLRLHIGQEEDEAINNSLESDGRFRGEELFYPLVFDDPSNLQEYLGDKGVTVFIDMERLFISEAAMLKEYEELYDRAKEEGKTRPRPDRLVMALKTALNVRGHHVEFHSLSTNDKAEPFQLACGPGRSFFGNIALLRDELISLLSNGYNVFVFAESESQSQRIAYLLRDIDGIEVGPAAISSGFMLPEAGIMAICENEIFGRRKKAPHSVHRAPSAVIETFVDLSAGDFIVHMNYGIGLFKGIERLQAAGTERDYIELEYAGNETVFIPIEQVNLIQRYIGQEEGSPRLDRLGGKTWARKKAHVRKSVEELADRLIALYARRQMAVGFAFPKDDDFQISFEADFPWQETADQISAVADVKSDMESPRPMDRLICGDVGYGKTEIAMRAAFKAIMGGRQVAYLCPTTILAEQHHESFSERFKRFPVTIGMLSRFVPTAERKNVIKGLREGKVDIVIGTHRILSKDVQFKNIGLIIIDEEQRFGVKDKERLKEVKASVDCLTLSATPIPRTLHMSMVKIRDMSLLRTPPRNRRPIETFIQDFDEELIARAIRREMDRGGQVFFLHNHIQSLEWIKGFLQKLVPEAFIEAAHGRMSSRELEDIMHRFVHGSFQVLVSTTIIENGIDIPNVNTIIIDRADMYGISQLYQLRGRVGRSGRAAYAYLLYPDQLNISELAMKRLQVISDFTELGSGFKIAMKDMEIRGVGNLLGAQQKGDIYAVGFDLYLRLLDEAVRKRMDGEDDEAKHETYLELEYSGFIPDSYITDSSEKMDVYKKIAAVSTDTELQGLFSELHDRYGPLPDEVHSLVSIAEIKIICEKLKVSSLKERNGLLQVSFGKVSMLSVDKVMNLISTGGGRVKLHPAKPECLIFETGKVGLREKSAFIRERLEALL